MAVTGKSGNRSEQVKGRATRPAARLERESRAPSEWNTRLRETLRQDLTVPGLDSEEPLEPCPLEPADWPAPPELLGPGEAPQRAESQAEARVALARGPARAEAGAPVQARAGRWTAPAGSGSYHPRERDRRQPANCWSSAWAYREQTGCAAANTSRRRRCRSRRYRPWRRPAGEKKQVGLGGTCRLVYWNGARLVNCGLNCTNVFPFRHGLKNGR
jgi:hypothetical protein